MLTHNTKIDICNPQLQKFFKKKLEEHDCPRAAYLRFSFPKDVKTMKIVSFDIPMMSYAFAMASISASLDTGTSWKPFIFMDEQSSNAFLYDVQSGVTMQKLSRSVFFCDFLRKHADDYCFTDLDVARILLETAIEQKKDIGVEFTGSDSPIVLFPANETWESFLILLDLLV